MSQLAGLDAWHASRRLQRKSVNSPASKPATNEFSLDSVQDLKSSMPASSDTDTDFIAVIGMGDRVLTLVSALHVCLSTLSQILSCLGSR